MGYIQKCCNYRCFGHPTEFEASIWNIYDDLAIKLLTPRQIMNALDYVAPSHHAYTLTKQEAIISELAMLQVCDTKDGKVFIEFDESEMDMRPSEEYYSEMDNEYF